MSTEMTELAETTELTSGTYSEGGGPESAPGGGVGRTGGTGGVGGVGVKERPVPAEPTSSASTAPAEASSEARSGSLKPVLDILPDSVYDNPDWKGYAYFGRDLLMYAGLVTALILVANVFAVIALEAAIAVVISGLFIVGHDAAHGALFKSKRKSSWIGHVAMLPSWHVYEGWILGHNRIHHAFTVRQGYDFVWHPATPEEFRAMSPAGRLLHRLEWSWAGAGLYYL
ncbi:MAG: fatty acid desaturase, partial [Acidimicrobiales bacterium]